MQVMFLEITQLNSHNTIPPGVWAKVLSLRASPPKRRPNDLLDSLVTGPHLDILLVPLYELLGTEASFE